jgi:hypothetical protein
MGLLWLGPGRSCDCSEGLYSEAKPYDVPRITVSIACAKRLDSSWPHAAGRAGSCGLIDKRRAEQPGATRNYKD